jgi:arabinose-5-phosphate isomerase
MTQTSPTPLATLERSETSTEALLERARTIIDVEIAGLNDIKAQLDQGFLQAIEIIEACPGRVIITGMGKSGLIGKKIAATLSSTGTPAYFLHPAEGSHGDLGMIMKQDVVIAISNSGETPEILSILPLVKRFNVPLIAMTGNLASTLAQRSSATLNVAVQQEACPLGLAPTASTTACLALGDALAVVLLERKGFTQEDFAIFHPAGSLGKRLLLKVEDVMHTGSNLPIVTTQATFLEALMEITSKKLGLTLVVNPNTRVVEGVLTDGDVRRALTQVPNIQAVVLTDVMSSSPKIIEADALAVSALRIMEENKITSLLIKAEDNTPHGIIHLHEILKTGIH